MGLYNGLLFFVFVGLLLTFNIGFASIPVAFFIYETLIFMSFVLTMSEHRRFPWGRGLLGGFLLGALAMSLIALVLLGGGWGEVREVLLQGAPLRLGFLLLFQSFVATGEELAFRGYIQPHLRQRLGTLLGVGLTSLLFAAIHAPAMLFSSIAPANGLIMFTTLMLGGAVLGLLALEYGLASAVGFHLSWNYFQYHIYGLGGGLLDPAPLLRAAYRPDAPPLLTGGQCLGGPCGPEASLLAVLLLATGVLLLGLRWRTQSQPPGPTEAPPAPTTDSQPPAGGG
ncbi:MAG: CPBP family intramembrane metalloprotease [Euryarchaeota archaeon]|nr:CPBP family intramembrane metalloprotease [Euryarchaeota archaeon]